MQKSISLFVYADPGLTNTTIHNAISHVQVQTCVQFSEIAAGQIVAAPLILFTSGTRLVHTIILYTVVYLQ